MKNITLIGFIETLGVFSVVASLIFVGLQLRQDQEIAIANQYQARAETSISNYRSRLESEIYISARTKLLNGDEDKLTPEEHVAFRQSIRMDFVTADNDYYQYSNGFISDEYWKGRRSRVKNSLRNKLVRNIYIGTVSTDSFGQFIVELLAEIDAE